MYAAVDYLRLGSVKIPNLLPRESKCSQYSYRRRIRNKLLLGWHYTCPLGYALVKYGPVCPPMLCLETYHTLPPWNPGISCKTHIHSRIKHMGAERVKAKRFQFMGTRGEDLSLSSTSRGISRLFFTLFKAFGEDRTHDSKNPDHADDAIYLLRR